MIFDAQTVYDMLTANWVETNPAIADVFLAMNEFNPNNPAIQILMENFNTKEDWVIDSTYKTTQTFKITVFLKPPMYDPIHLTDNRLTFMNCLSEVSRIIHATHFGLSAQYHLEAGWKSISIPQGYGDSQSRIAGRTVAPIPGLSKSPEPIVFKSSQDITFEYYNIGGEAMSEFLKHLVEDLTPQLGGNLDLNGHGIIFPTKTITDVKTDLTDNSDTELATQKAIATAINNCLIAAKAYSDAEVIQPIVCTEYTESKVMNTRYYNTGTSCHCPIFLSITAQSTDVGGNIGIATWTASDVIIDADLTPYIKTSTHVGYSSIPLNLYYIIPYGTYFALTDTNHANITSYSITVVKWTETLIGGTV